MVGQIAGRAPRGDHWLIRLARRLLGLLGYLFVTGLWEILAMARQQRHGRELLAIMP